ncbi:hypothetical protein BJ742DRAFT_777259 [Cladochytrium replicatum]|nr:hypothetical protein BJ742DRAFT_777259 [Cladochytrium replicatum]
MSSPGECLNKSTRFAEKQLLARNRNLLVHLHLDFPNATFSSWSPSNGVLSHLNKSATIQVHHCGRTRYMLIAAKAPLGKGLMDSEGMPLTKVVTMGRISSVGK